jgi:hypothetical protein
MDLAQSAQYIPPSAIWMWSFPVTYVIHLAEEYWGGEGYMAYLYRIRGVHLSTGRFFFFQGLGIVLASAGIFISLALKWPRFYLSVMGAVVLSNGITHTVTAIRHKGYGPGLVCSLLLWIPLGLGSLIVLSGQMPVLRLIVSSSIGFAINGVVALIAIRGGKLTQ